MPQFFNRLKFIALFKNFKGSLLVFNTELLQFYYKFFNIMKFLLDRFKFWLLVYEFMHMIYGIFQGARKVCISWRLSDHFERYAGSRVNDRNSCNEGLHYSIVKAAWCFETIEKRNVALKKKLKSCYKKS